MPFWDTLLSEIMKFILSIFWYLIALVIVVISIRLLIKRKTYERKIVEIKEGPLEVSNLLRDVVKRQIIRSLSKEKKYVSAISKEINENAPITRYHLKQLEKANLVKSFKLAREAYFSLTDKGRWSLEAINYYYPTTNIQLLFTRFKKILGVFRISKLMFRKKQKTSSQEIKL